MKFINQKSEKELDPSKIIHMGRNNYYWNDQGVLTMTAESPDSYQSWKDKKNHGAKPKAAKPKTPRQVWEEAYGEIDNGDVVVCRERGEEPNIGNVERISRAELMRRNLEETFGYGSE